MRIKKGDTVKVLYGKDSGKTGKVLRVVAKEKKLVVEGVNMFKKHVKGDGQSKTSEIVTISKPLHISKVMVVDPSDNKPTRVKYEVKADGSKVRVSSRTKKQIDLVEKTEKKAPVKKSKKSTTTKKPVAKKVTKKSKSTSKK